MPEISRFFGIIITMNANDHNPPHIHAKYQDEQAIFDIQSGEILRGKFSERAARLVQDWIQLHSVELMVDCNLATKNQLVFPITPLK